MKYLTSLSDNLDVGKSCLLILIPDPIDAVCLHFTFLYKRPSKIPDNNPKNITQITIKLQI